MHTTLRKIVLPLSGHGTHQYQYLHLIFSCPGLARAIDPEREARSLIWMVNCVGLRAAQSVQLTNYLIINYVGPIINRYIYDGTALITAKNLR